MYKRGLSGIVATVLIVLLAVAAVAIIWNFIRPVLGDEENSEQIKLLTIRFSVLPQAVKIDDSLNLIALSVKREIGGGNIDGYNVVLEDDSKRTYSYKVPLQIKELEVQRLNIDYSGVVISIPKRIFIVPYIKSLKGRDIVGYDAGSYNVQASDLVAQTTCSTNGDCISFECKTATCNINTGCLYSSANQGGSCNNGAGTCNNGVCVSSGVGCVSVCTSGAKQCSGTSGYQTCGDYNSDSCTEWGTATACSSGETCLSGECVIEITSCGVTLNQANKKYVLTQDLIGIGGFTPCIVINADGVILDGNNRNIIGGGGGVQVINLASPPNGVIIENLIIPSTTYYGIFFSGCNNNIIQNNEILSGQLFGISLNSVSGCGNNQIINNRVENILQGGISLNSANGNTIDNNNVINNPGIGIILTNSINNNFNNNYVCVSGFVDFNCDATSATNSYSGNTFDNENLCGISRASNSVICP